MADYADASAQDSLSRNALEMWNNEMESGNLHVDSFQDECVEVVEEDVKRELEIMLSGVKSVAESLRYLRSKARILAVPGLTNLSLEAEQLELEDGSSASEVANSDQDSLVIEDGACSLKMLESIQVVTDVLESLLRSVTTAESETSFRKESVTISEEELRRKTIQIENLSLRLEDMKRIVHGNKTILDETAKVINKLVEDSMRDKERALENEEELRRVKRECESLRNYVDTSTTIIETLLSSERKFQTMEARLVAKSTQLEGEKAQKEVKVQKLMEENVKLTSLLDKKEAQILALNEQCKIMALNASSV